MPALLGMILFVVGPALALLPIAASSWQLGLSPVNWVGLGNFTALADDPYFVAALQHTFLYTLVVAPLSLAAGLGAALLVDGTHRLRHLYRGLLFLPTIATMAAMSIAWEALLHPTLGLVNTALRLVGIAGPHWLQDESFVFPTLMAIGVWQNFGLAMVFFLAGLRSVPSELYDAAAIDGLTSSFDRFRHVTWPLLGPIALFVLVLTAERAFSVFDTVQVLTQGGPGTTSEVLLHLLFVEGVARLRAGYGAAIAITYLASLGGLVLLQRRVFDQGVHYQ
jgi:multiple sugar transport system permease protein